MGLSLLFLHLISPEKKPFFTVDIDLTLFGQLHRCHHRKKLGDRTDSINRFRGCRHLFGCVGIAKALGPDDSLIIDNRNAEAHHLVSFVSDRLRRVRHRGLNRMVDDRQQPNSQR